MEVVLEFHGGPLDGESKPMDSKDLEPQKILVFLTDSGDYVSKGPYDVPGTVVAMEFTWHANVTSEMQVI